ncbi:hypothetical protein TNCV_3147571 [Trichonephila clavipes]|nr:hypothetical protein TNCV_3147571 [Trichonephila clavipes]
MGWSLARMNEDRCCKKIFLAKPIGNRPRGRLPLRWIGCVDKDLNILKVKNWKTVAKSRDSWRKLLEKARAHLLKIDPKVAFPKRAHPKNIKKHSTSRKLNSCDDTPLSQNLNIREEIFHPNYYQHLASAHRPRFSIYCLFVRNNEMLQSWIFVTLLGIITSNPRGSLVVSLFGSSLCEDESDLQEILGDLFSISPSASFLEMAGPQIED